MSDDPVPRGRPRDGTADRRILDAAAELIREHGPRAVHIDAVASRSGVARTTIYRRYRDRRDLLAATLHRVADRGAPPGDEPVEDRFRWLLDRVRDVVDDGLGRGGVAAVLTDDDPEFTEALREAFTTQLAPLAVAMREDAERGVIGPDVDPDTVLTVAFGAYLGELLRHGEAAPDWLDRTAALLTRGVGGQGVTP